MFGRRLSLPMRWEELEIEAISEGVNAYYHDVDRDACPYRPDTREHRDWLRGWDEAKVGPRDNASSPLRGPFVFLHQLIALLWLYSLELCCAKSARPNQVTHRGPRRPPPTPNSARPARHLELTCCIRLARNKRQHVEKPGNARFSM